LYVCGHGQIDMLDRHRKVCYCEAKPKQSNAREKESIHETQKNKRDCIFIFMFVAGF